MELSSKYVKNVKKRSWIHFAIGAIIRLKKYGVNELVIFIAKIKGASVGKESYITFKLACSSNSNLVIGNNSIIESHKIDLRQKVIIGNNVIVNKGTTIIRQSHNINSSHFELTGNDLLIEDFAWLTTNTLIAPSCKIIGKGTVLAAGAVLSKDTGHGEVWAGNPAKVIRKREVLHTDLLLPSMQGRDFRTYLKARLSNGNRLRE